MRVSKYTVIGIAREILQEDVYVEDEEDYLDDQLEDDWEDDDWEDEDQ
jgi:hypothetical protein